MNYVKKMCILRQVKQGFSGDGKTLSGLIKIEQYGKNLAVEVSIINFAPLASGEYYCLLSDGKGKTEMLSLRGKSIFNILSDIDISGGFCGVICYVKTEVVPIAYGINGKGTYDWRDILNKALPPVFPSPQNGEDEIAGSTREITPSPPTMSALNEKSAEYDDEEVATENYYEEEAYERVEPTQANEDAHVESGAKSQIEEAGTNSAAHENAESVLHPFQKESDGYYLSIKRELDELFSKYPQDKTLCGAFSRSEWARIRGRANAPQYLVGALYEEGKVKYICYALAAEEGGPPEEIKGVCSFVPAAPWSEREGFYVIFQSAGTGECVKPPRV